MVLAFSHHGEVVELPCVNLQLINRSVQHAILCKDPIHCQTRENKFNATLDSSVCCSHSSSTLTFSVIRQPYLLTDREIIKGLLFDIDQIRVSL